MTDDSAFSLPPSGLTSSDHSLSGSLIVAMPALDDDFFSRSVILLCQHTKDMALGLVLNQPLEKINFGRLAKDLDLEFVNDSPKLKTLPVYRGGPVETERGFVLHSLDYLLAEQTLKFGQKTCSFGLTANRDILTDITKGKGPEKFRLALGYAGWRAGQLEKELSENAWLIVPARHDLVYHTESKALWERALATIGIPAKHLSKHTGSA